MTNAALLLGEGFHPDVPRHSSCWRFCSADFRHPRHVRRRRNRFSRTGSGAKLAPAAAARDDFALARR